MGCSGILARAVRGCVWPNAYEIRDWQKERKEEKPFSQRELREKVGWKKSALAEHVKELVQAEYLIAQTESGPGRRVRYSLDWDGRGLEGEKFFQGLTSTTTMKDPNISGSLPGQFRATSGNSKTNAKARQTSLDQESGKSVRTSEKEDR